MPEKSWWYGVTWTDCNLEPTPTIFHGVPRTKVDGGDVVLDSPVASRVHVRLIAKITDEEARKPIQEIREIARERWNRANNI